MGGALSTITGLTATTLLAGGVSAANVYHAKDTPVADSYTNAANNYTPFLILFGAVSRPWNTESWLQVSDTVRGGSSKAELRYIDPSNRFAGVSFEGKLDTKTLGGAGFASQVYRQPISIDSRYSSFFLEVEPIESGSDHVIRDFTFGVKNAPTPPGDQPTSSVIYQFDFEVPLLDRVARTKNQESKLEELIKIKIPFKSLVPTYRGRRKDDEKPFDPQKTTEISIMCRSFFNHQSGPFHLNILRLGVE